MTQSAEALKNDVQVRVNSLMDIARRQFTGTTLVRPVIRYDLKSCRVAGAAARNGSYIRLHPWILNEYTECYIKQTVGHEVAHCVTSMVFGDVATAHGAEWHSVMALFDLEPLVKTRSYSMALAPKGMRTFTYECLCERQMELTAIRHNKVVKGKAVYRCGKCHAVLRLAP